MTRQLTVSIKSDYVYHCKCFRPVPPDVGSELSVYSLPRNVIRFGFVAVTRCGVLAPSRDPTALREAIVGGVLQLRPSAAPLTFASAGTGPFACLFDQIISSRCCRLCVCVCVRG